MTSPIRLFQLAQLAEASYANLIGGTKTLLAELQNTVNDMKFSTTQAAEFVKNWKVVSHQPNTESGFSATLFQYIGNDPNSGYTNGELVYAIRGTELGILSPDLASDLGDIVTDGLALDQIVDMYNDWARITAGDGQLYQAAKLVTDAALTVERGSLQGDEVAAFDAVWLSQGYIIDSPLGLVRKVEFDWSDAVFGESESARVYGDVNIDVTQLADVTGHSLGGHLASAFTRLFPGYADALTVNGAGYPTGLVDGLSGNAASNITNLFASLGGSNQFDSSSIYNIYGEKNLEFITMHNQLGLVQQGSSDSLFIEQPTPIAAGFGHSSTQMTDSLAVANLFIRLDSTLASYAPQQALAELNAILEKSSHLANQSLEKTVISLRRLVLGEQSPMAIQTYNREELYASIATLQNSNLFKALEGKVELAASPSTATEARDDFGAFLSLYYLTPFALKTSNDTNASILKNINATNAALAEKWSADNVLTTEQKANGEANFSQEWLADRIAILKWKNELAEEDFVDVNGVGYQSNGGLLAYYEDRESNIAFNIGLGVGDRKQVIFGTSAVEPDNIDGGNKDDHLYGMGGDDVVNGGNGNDYLEGNEGNDNLKGDTGNDILLGGNGQDVLDGGVGDDQLKGGAGVDVYQFNGSFGTDVIIDSDGQGFLIADSNPLVGGDKKLENIYKHEGTGYIYSRVNDGKTIIVTKEGSNNRIIVNNWSEDKDLNIKLNGDIPAPPEATLGLTGDFKKKIDDNNTASTDDDTYVMTDGNYTRDETALNGEPGAADLISGTDAVVGIRGKDVIYGLGGDDALSGKSGDDFIDGGSGSDVIQAGLGKDTIYGGSGDDIIYGSSDQDLIKPTEVDFEKPINTFANPQGTGFNWFSGYTSTLENGVPDNFHSSQRNRLDGDAGNIIDGGIGNDFIAAGTGEDSVRGGEGKDLILGMDKDDILFGDGDNDYIYGDGDKQSATSAVWSLPNNHGNDVIDGGDGDDVLLGQGKNDIIFGGNNNDKIWGDDRNQTLLDGAYHGNDYIDGGSGNDQIRGGGGDDVIFAGSENDLVWGDSETESLLSATYHGNDYLDGGEGNDTLVGGAKNDTVLGGGGNDYLHGDLSILDLAGRNHGYDYLDGGEGNDQLLGGGMNDTLLGGKGDDLLLGDDQYPISGGYYGDDYLDGGDGSDTLQGGSGDDTLLGGSGSDRLEGEDGYDYLDGGDGADYLIGGRGNDTLVGGGQGVLGADGIFAGGDNLEGGIGNDTYYAGAGDYINDNQGINTFIINGAKVNDIQMNTLATGSGLALAVSLGSAEQTVFIQDALVENVITTYKFSDGSQVEHGELVGNTLVTSVNLTTTSANVAYGGLNDDVLTARNSTSTATLSGGGGNDILTGNAGNDVLKGGTGNDSLAGGSGADQMQGGAGADVMSGNAGDDYYFVDDVADQVFEVASEGFDTIESSVDFTISTGNSIEKLILTGSAVTATGNELDNHITGNDSNNILTGNGGDDELLGGLGDDTYVLSIGDGADAIDDLQGLNTITFGSGITRESLNLSQYQGNDGSYYLYIQYGPGSDSVAIKDGLAGAIQKYQFDDGSVVTHAELIGSEDIPFEIFGTSEADSLWGANNADILEGDLGDDELFGLNGNDSLMGSIGLDTLSGGDGDDLLDGGMDDDLLIGGTGRDTYLMYWGMGQDSVVDGDGGEINEIRLDSGILFSDITGLREGNDLLLHFKGNEQEGILIKDYYNGQQWILRSATDEGVTVADFIVNDTPSSEPLIQQAIDKYLAQAKKAYYQVKRADGYRLHPDGLMRKTDIEIGESGTYIHNRTDRLLLVTQESDDREINRISWSDYSGEIIVSSVYTQASDYFGKGSSNSFRASNAGSSSNPSTPNPIFIKNDGSGYGSAQIGGGSNNVIMVPGVGAWYFPPGSTTPSNATASGTISAPRPYLTRQFASFSTTAVEEIIGGDSDNTFLIRGGAFTVDAGKGNDLIDAKGAISIIGSWGNATYFDTGVFLYGNDGNDSIIGGDANDSLIGGDGNDFHDGGYGSDTYYIYSDHTGTDVILDSGTIGGYGDSDGGFYTNYMDWYYRSIGRADWIDQLYTLDDYTDLPPLPKVYPTEFAKIEALMNNMRPIYGEDTDTVEFGQGITLEDLTFSWGQIYGDYKFIPDYENEWYGITGTLDISWGANNKVRIAVPILDGHPWAEYSEVEYEEMGGYEFPRGDRWLIGAGIERFKFADGTVLSMAEMANLAPSLPSLNQVISFDLGIGSQSVSYLWKSTLKFGAGISPDDIIVSRDDSDLLLTHANQVDQLRITDWFLESAIPPLLTAVFKNSYQEWDAATFNQLSIYQATVGDDHLIGSASGDIIYGGKGNDVIEGGAGSDELHGGYDNDILNAGAGNEDFLYGEAGDDVLNANTTAALYADGGEGNDTINGGSGYDYLYGGDGDDVLNAGAGTEGDALYGDAGNDVLNAQDAAYVFAAGGEGNDLINGSDYADELYGESGNDTINAGGGNDYIEGGSGDDLLMGGAGNDTYLFDQGDGVDVINDSSGTDTLQFDYGVTEDMLSLGLGSLVINVGDFGDAIHIEGFDKNDVYGSSTIERFRFYNGVELSYTQLLARGFDINGDNTANVITGTNIHDRIYGLGGDDVIASGSGDDLLDGGSGNDLLQGGDGNDAYIFGLGSGVDAIEDNSGSFDKVILQEGIHPDDLEITQEGDYIAISLKNTSDKLSIRWYDSDISKIEAIEFADGTSWDAETLENLAVPPNSAPILASPFADQQILEDAAFSYSIAGVFEDPDAGDVLSYSVTLENGDPLPPWLSFDSDTLTFSGTPENGDVGNLAVKVTVTDKAGAFVSSSFDINVVNTNDAPTVANAIADQVTDEDVLFSFTVPADSFADADLDDSLTYSATLADGSALPAWLSFDAETLTFSGTPENADVGNLLLKVTATDVAGASISSDFDITINNTNDAPVVNVALVDQTTDEDALFSFTVPADTFADVDLGDTLTYSASLADGSALPVWLSFDGQTQTFSGTPENADVDSLSLKVTVTDTAGASISSDFDITVNNTNDAPILNGFIPNQMAYEGQTFSLQVNEDLFADVDLNDELSYSAKLADGNALPAWLNFDATNLVFTGMPGNEDVGGWQVHLTATDLAGASTSTLFTLDLPRSPDQVLVGDTKANVLAGGTGHDTINGMDGSDELYGGAGNDTLNGGSGSDLLNAGLGDDILEFHADGLQILPIFTYNQGSPGNPGSGDTAFAILHWTSKDSFDGGAGTDTLNGTSGWDFITLDDQNGKARITGIEAIYAGAGHDVVNLTSTQNSYGDIYMNGEGGNDVLWANAGVDILQGETGKDHLDSGAGNGLLDGGTGNDTLSGGNDADFFIGGNDRDTLITGDGQDVIAFNVGDGVDSVYSTSDADNTISLGGNIDYADLSLRKSGKDLVLKVSNQDRIVLQDWYESGPSVATLQVITEAMQGFNPDGSNALLDNKVETFDFAAIVNKFDEARSAHPFINNWSIADALLDFHLGGSDSTAIGGDLAYQYGKAGALTGISAAAAQGIIADSSFGQSAQALQPLASLQEGLIKLS